MPLARAKAVILLLSTLAAAAPFAPGTKFGSVGLDYHSTGDTIYSFDPDYYQFKGTNPFFRVGAYVTRNLAVGADLALLNTFPLRGDVFTNTPVFAFCPMVMWLPIRARGIQAYGTAGAGVTYGLLSRQGWRVRAGAGALFDVGIPVSFGPEVGYYADFVRTKTPYQNNWLTGTALFIGLRLSDLRL